MSHLTKRVRQKSGIFQHTFITSHNIYVSLKFGLVNEIYTYLR